MKTVTWPTWWAASRDKLNVSMPSLVTCVHSHQRRADGSGAAAPPGRLRGARCWGATFTWGHYRAAHVSPRGRGEPGEPTRSLEKFLLPQHPELQQLRCLRHCEQERFCTHDREIFYEHTSHRLLLSRETVAQINALEKHLQFMLRALCKQCADARPEPLGHPFQ